MSKVQLDIINGFVNSEKDELRYFNNISVDYSTLMSIKECILKYKEDNEKYIRETKDLLELVKDKNEWVEQILPIKCGKLLIMNRKGPILYLQKDNEKNIYNFCNLANNHNLKSLTRTNFVVNSKEELDKINSIVNDIYQKYSNIQSITGNFFVDFYWNTISVWYNEQILFLYDINKMRPDYINDNHITKFGGESKILNNVYIKK